MVRAGPDVQEDQGPEVNNGKAVGINRAIGCLWQEIVHKAQVGCGQEECDGIMSIPPLDQGILDTGIDRVAFQKADRDCDGIHDVKHGHGDESRNVEPDGHVDMPGPSFDDGAKHIPSKDDPYDSHHDVNRPFQFGILLAVVIPKYRSGQRRR